MSEAIAPRTEENTTGCADMQPLIGRVIGNRMEKTVTVLVERRVKHPLYKKYVRRSTKIHAHDEEGECGVGDSVSIVQCRPLSRTKAWRVLGVITRSK